MWGRTVETTQRNRGSFPHHSGCVQLDICFFCLYIHIPHIERNDSWDGSYLEPEHVFMPILIQMAMLLYPLELIRPSNPAKVYTVLFAPLLIVVIAGLFGGIGYTYIDSLSDLWHNIGKPEVWFRIVVPSGNDRASEPAEADTL